MSGIEMMAASMLKAFGVDPDAIRQEVERRIAMFEKNIEVLNANLAQINSRLENIETKMGIEHDEDKHASGIADKQASGIANGAIGANGAISKPVKSANDTTEPASPHSATGIAPLADARNHAGKSVAADTTNIP